MLPYLDWWKWNEDLDLVIDAADPATWIPWIGTLWVYLEPMTPSQRELGGQKGHETGKTRVRSCKKQKSLKGLQSKRWWISYPSRNRENEGRWEENWEVSRSKCAVLSQWGVSVVWSNSRGWKVIRLGSVNIWLWVWGINSHWRQQHGVHAWAVVCRKEVGSHGVPAIKWGAFPWADGALPLNQSSPAQKLAHGPMLAWELGFTGLQWDKHRNWE